MFTRYENAIVSRFNLIDFIGIDGKTEICRETLEQVKARHPDAELVNVDEWIRRKEIALCTEPVEITPERFDEMLNVLPPQRWVTGNDCESFEMCEHTSGRVTTVFVRNGQKYFEFQAVAGQSLAAHMRKLREQSPAVKALIASAAQAIEQNSEDDLERFAEGL